MKLRKGCVSFRKFAGLALIAFLSLFSPLACKKSPITPDIEKLTRPIIWFDSSRISFTAFAAGGNPSPQFFRVKNAGKSKLDYTLTDDADWLSVEPAGGSSTGQLVEHAIIVNKDGLAAQEADYSATITISCPDAYNTPQKITVRLKINQDPPPEIWVSTSEISFAAAVGSNPSSQILRVKNVGESTLNYTITWDVGWLSVSPASGSSTGQENSHVVAVSSASLGVGTYNGTITVASSAASNSPQHIAVTLEVTGIPADNEIYITCNPSSGGTGTTISIPISIRGNTGQISTFGLDLTFDSGLFQYQGTNNGSLNGNWVMVEGNVVSPGTVRVGGLAGSGSPVPTGSMGSIAVVTLKVTGTAYNNGHQSQITIRSYIDDITGMRTDPYTTIFTFWK